MNNYVATRSTYTDLVIIALIVVHVKNAVKLRVPAEAQCSFPGRCKPLSGCLPGKALHLDVEELPEVTEPLNQLGCDTTIELCGKRIATFILSIIRIIFKEIECRSSVYLLVSCLETLTV